MWKTILLNGEKAYVWSPLIARYAGKSNYDPNLLFLIGPSSDPLKTKIKTFDIEKKQVVDEIEIKGIRSFHGLLYISSSASKGVPYVQEFLLLDYSAEACGETGGTVYLAFDGKKLRPFFSAAGSGDGGFFEGTEIIFPSDPMGEKGIIHVVDMGGESGGPSDFLPKVKLDYFTHKKYTWNGEKLIPIE